LKNNIRLERARLNINQEELGDKVNVTKQTIHSIENGKHMPSILLAFKIAAVFKKKVDEIFILEAKDWK
jgi:putative transcriptional regulator